MKKSIIGITLALLPIGTNEVMSKPAVNTSKGYQIGQTQERDQWISEEIEELRRSVLSGEFEESLPRLQDLHKMIKNSDYSENHPEQTILVLTLLVDTTTQMQKYALLESYSKELLDIYINNNMEEKAKEMRAIYLEAKEERENSEQEESASQFSFSFSEEIDAFSRCTFSLPDTKDTRTLINYYYGCPINHFLDVTGLLPQNKYQIPGGNERLQFVATFSRVINFKCEYIVDVNPKTSEIVHMEMRYGSDNFFDSGESECRDILKGLR